jgi:ubiquinone/menaquinone biosynthesis C-methylase UbiE
MRLKKIWWKLPINRYFKKRRIKYISNILGGIDNKDLKILDVGCGNGRDFITYFKDNKDISFTGVDLKDRGLRQKNFKLVKTDAKQLPFKDNEFDIVISIGVLEHIVPIEKLCKVISEIDRVGKRYVVIVPCISTPYEPHAEAFRWQLRGINSKRGYNTQPLIYLSDEGWLSFKGFKDGKINRFWYIPGIKKDLVIYN